MSAVTYTDTLRVSQPSTDTPRRVGSYTTFDTQLAHSGIQDLELALVKNLVDRDPPYTDCGAWFVGGYDLSYADVRGHFVYGTASHEL